MRTPVIAPCLVAGRSQEEVGNRPGRSGGMAAMRTSANLIADPRVEPDSGGFGANAGSVASAR